MLASRIQSSWFDKGAFYYTRAVFSGYSAAFATEVRLHRLATDVKSRNALNKSICLDRQKNHPPGLYGKVELRRHTLTDDESLHGTAPSAGTIPSTNLPPPAYVSESDARGHSHFHQPEPQMFDDSSPNPTSTSLAIWAGVKDGGKKYIGAKCLLDSGCQDNWISVGVLKRGEILADMKPLSGQGDTKFVGFNGDVARPLGIITITWFMKSAATARDTDFLVAEKGPFDVLLGRRFILSECHYRE